MASLCILNSGGRMYFYRDSFSLAIKCRKFCVIFVDWLGMNDALSCKLSSTIRNCIIYRRPNMSNGN